MIAERIKEYFEKEGCKIARFDISMLCLRRGAIWVKVRAKKINLFDLKEHLKKYNLELKDLRIVLGDYRRGRLTFWLLWGDLD